MFFPSQTAWPASQYTGKSDRSRKSTAPTRTVWMPRTTNVVPASASKTRLNRRRSSIRLDCLVESKSVTRSAHAVGMPEYLLRAGETGSGGGGYELDGELFDATPVTRLGPHAVREQLR